MDIFKLIFEHDLVFDEYTGREDTSGGKGPRTTLEEFMSPTQTYTKYYLTGTQFGRDYRFGLSTLQKYEEVLQALTSLFPAQKVVGSSGVIPESQLPEALSKAPGNAVFLIGKEATEADYTGLNAENHTGVREMLPKVVPLLDQDITFVRVEKAHHGTDLHLFSKQNLYEPLFHTFQPFTSHKDFRYFSINGKRVGSERSFYFETWTLNRPPHGFEEVTPEAVLR